MDKKLPHQLDDFTEILPIMEELGFFVNSNQVSFDDKATKFNPGNGWWLAEFSRLVYLENQKKIKQELKEAGFPKVKFFNDEGTQALVASNKTTIIVVFAGTEMDEGLADIITDLDIIPTKSESVGNVHRGFKEALDLVWDDIETYINSLKETRSLWYTGHSLGSALAILSASRFPGNGVYAFGAPRFGDRKFVKNISTPVYRIVKNRDIVARIPPPIFYRHAGELYFVTSDYKLLKSPTWFRKFYERLGGSEWRVLFLLFKLLFLKSYAGFILSYLHDHNMYNYSVAMWNNIEDYKEPEDIDKDDDTNIYLYMWYPM